MRFPGVLSVAAVSVAISAAALLEAGCTVRKDQPSLVGQDIQLTIIHTSDIHSRLFPYNVVPSALDQGYKLLPINAPFGGIARISTLVKSIRASSDRSLWLDSGDCFQGAPVFSEFKGEAEMRALTVAGLEGAVVGTHELDLGAKNLFEKIDSWAGYPLLAANYAWDDPPPAAAISNGRSLRDVDLVVVVSHLGPDDDDDLDASDVSDPNEALPLQGVDLVGSTWWSTSGRAAAIPRCAAGSRRSTIATCRSTTRSRTIRRLPM
jgi:2',3'-cyclic-nucleotide 2'-phosphodiesterase (5'-nucleotidase family)